MRHTSISGEDLGQRADRTQHLTHARRGYPRVPEITRSDSTSSLDSRILSQLAKRHVGDAATQSLAPISPFSSLPRRPRPSRAAAGSTCPLRGLGAAAFALAPREDSAVPAERAMLWPSPAETVTTRWSAKEGFDLLRQRLVQVVAVAHELAPGSIAPAPDTAIGGEGEVVLLSSPLSAVPTVSRGGGPCVARPGCRGCRQLPAVSSRPVPPSGRSSPDRREGQTSSKALGACSVVGRGWRHPLCAAYGVSRWWAPRRAQRRC